MFLYCLVVQPYQTIYTKPAAVPRASSLLEPLDNDIGTTMIISQIMKENFQYQKTCGLVYWRRRFGGRCSEWKMFCTQGLFGGGGGGGRGIVRHHVTLPLGLARREDGLLFSKLKFFVLS